MMKLPMRIDDLEQVGCAIKEMWNNRTVRPSYYNRTGLGELASLSGKAREYIKSYWQMPVLNNFSFTARGPIPSCYMTRKLLIKEGNCEEALVSYGRKFKTLFTTRARMDVSGFGYLVTSRNLTLLCVIGALCSALLLILRQRTRSLRQVRRMISRVIDHSEANMILKTRMHIEFSTEYSHLTMREARKMFADGCLSIRRDGSTIADDEGRTRVIPPLSITADMLSEEGHSAFGLALQVGTNLEDLPTPGNWHARWDKPPELRADSWANQGRTQRISYDVVDLGRTSSKNHIRYVSAAEYGLNTGWIDFCHLENDGLPNILRDWEQTYEVMRIWNHSFMKTPSGEFMWVPDYDVYKEHYIELHRIKAIANQITLTMRTGGSWCNTTFMTSYRGVVSGNSSTNMGHKIPTVTAKRYLPQVMSLVRASCSFSSRQ
jgi:hypothetical protein